MKPQLESDSTIPDYTKIKRWGGKDKFCRHELIHNSSTFLDTPYLKLNNAYNSSYNNVFYNHHTTVSDSHHHPENGDNGNLFVSP